MMQLQKYSYMWPQAESSTVNFLLALQHTLHRSSMTTPVCRIYLVQFGSDGREVIWYVFLDLLWLSSQHLPEPWWLLVLHERCDLRLPFTLILIYLFRKQPGGRQQNTDTALDHCSNVLCNCGPNMEADCKVCIGIWFVPHLAFVVLLSVALAPLQTKISSPVSCRKTKLAEKEKDRMLWTHTSLERDS